MPRKQRFKPSRKPQSNQAVVGNQQAAEGKETDADQADENVSQQQSSMNDEQPPREIERE
jgi:hypothetical protein